MSHRISRDKIVYSADRELVKVDLRPDGVDCVPLFGRSNFLSLHEGTELHVHEGCTEICLCLRGNLLFESNGQVYPFYPGRVFVSNSNEPHRMVSAPKGLSLYHFLFQVPGRGRPILGLPPDESRWLVHELTHFPVRLFPSSVRVKTAFERVLEVYGTAATKTPERRLRMRSAVLELLLALVETPKLPAQAAGRPNGKVRAMAEMMREHPDRNYPIGELAVGAALSTVAFSEAFKRETGLPPHAFLVKCRLEGVRRDLESGRLSIPAAAARYGFSSPRHLATSFRAMYGVSPSEVQKNNI